MRKTWTIAGISAATLLVALVGSLTVGSSSMSFSELIGLVVPSQPSPSALRTSILTELRIPRILMAAFVGAILAVCGVAMQAVTHNDLAEPYLLGVSSGASTGAVIAILFSTWQYGIIFGATIGSLASFALLMLLLRNTGGDATKVVLTGVLIGFLFQSLTSLVVTASGDAESTRSIMFWLLGVLGAARWPTLFAVIIVGSIGMLMLWALSRHLDALSLGGDTASTMGVPVVALRYIVLICVSLMTATTVASVGAIGFVGLIIPHAVRMLNVPKHASLIPLSALIGAVTLVIADAFARSIFAPQELPVGVITALIGVPMFFLILRRKH
ncbi:FecCD family ABC transporter permease [Corynebacterium pseudodiphtheriticum]|uniref:Iron ABC transporter permease n=1 Tax=Corynebacterium pseudodiphtheriticum TaxID=37637 RepID=A0ABT7FV44_9CORY|nr:iron ABC transporter permease [Corynebacterium pseudodiphtheriticum]MDK4206786.1 iron ABC transporter permease [Corynebacterium pseudodiphtheriticum]MDK4284948.1 iron ABC transporter permease [Corynebacterium pseudodiphtheriticum]MDK4289862.1 iron ABC transporter permease [Corynebacterium pseudodiphtheriticum]MDK4305918.1 iron ABC transporter permease [Corynebacterium pseudodiphtheriticum]MDK8395831.1 iron ABC transporter permease [Corynebacterium pseudodiphtheriticum]